MALSNPSPTSRKIFSVSDTTIGSGSVAATFTIPQDATSILCKFWTGANFTPNSTGAAKVTIQTTEDGGTTWRDVLGWTTGTAVANDNAHFQSVPVGGDLIGRGLSGWTGSVQASTLAPALVASVAAGAVSGLPVIATTGRVFIQYVSLVSVNSGVNVDIFAPTNDQH